jgi:hypothetical protein
MRRKFDYEPVLRKLLLARGLTEKGASSVIAFVSAQPDKFPDRRRELKQNKEEARQLASFEGLLNTKTFNSIRFTLSKRKSIKFDMPAILTQFRIGLDHIKGLMEDPLWHVGFTYSAEYKPETNVPIDLYLYLLHLGKLQREHRNLFFTKLESNNSFNRTAKILTHKVTRRNWPIGEEGRRR